VVGHGRINTPTFPDFFNPVLKSPPLIPLDGTVSQSQQDGQSKQNEGTDFGNLNDVVGEVIHNVSVHGSTESKLLGLWQGKGSRIEMHV